MNSHQDDVYEKFMRAEDALRDILYMFYTCVDYGFLYDDMGSENGKFDPYTYIDCEISITGYETDFSLLHNGSAIKIICSVLERVIQAPNPNCEKEKALIKSGRMDHIPELRDYLSKIIASSSQCNKEGQKIYQKYIAGYFKCLGNGF